MEKLVMFVKKIIILIKMEIVQVQISVKKEQIKELVNNVFQDIIFQVLEILV
jgi:hypothetical protein